MSIEKCKHKNEKAILAELGIWRCCDCGTSLIYSGRLDWDMAIQLLRELREMRKASEGQ